MKKLRNSEPVEVSAIAIIIIIIVIIILSSHNQSSAIQVPGATHGLLGLVEHALAHQEEAALTGPIAVHCR